MAEIRVRDVSPQIIEQLEKIAVDLKESTITKMLVKLIPRYWDMKKRIIEQNNEISKLAGEVNNANYKLSQARYELDDFVDTIKRHYKQTAGAIETVSKKAKTFGTKKPARPASSRATPKRIVPKSKNNSKTKTKSK